MHILKVRKTGTDGCLNSDYKSGVHLGIGAFNLVTNVKIYFHFGAINLSF